MPSSVFGKDVDDLFAFTCVKKVKIRDFRLGVFHRCVQLAILGYVIAKMLIIDKAYLKNEPVHGGAVLANYKLFAPPVTGSSEYCSVVGMSLANGHKCANGGTGVGCACVNVNEALAVPFEGITSNIALTSRVTFEKSPTPGSGDFTEQSYFVANFEKFSMRLSHSATTDDGDAKTMGEMTGSFLKSNGKDTEDVARCPGSGPVGDCFTVGKMLELAGLTLTPKMRFDGFNMVMYINYSSSGKDKLEYEYKFVAITDSEYKVLTFDKPVLTDLGLDASITHLTYNRHGMNLIIVQTGHIGKFSIQNLILAFVSGAAILSIASIAVEVVSTNILGLKDLYKGILVEETPDFSELRSFAETHGDDQLKANCLRYKEEAFNNQLRVLQRENSTAVGPASNQL